MDNPKDTMTMQGAQRLQRQIKQYWARKGLYPRVTVEAVIVHSEPTNTWPVHVVRSNMIGGLPPGSVA